VNKKVLVLAASPRKGGNSDILCGRFVTGAQEAGNETETIFLRDRKIGFCRACDSCRSSGECVQKDDMAEILEGMIAADVIVMATPVYFYTMNGPMKTLIDRTYARYREIKGKDFYFIMTAAVERRQALERTLEGFRGFTPLLPGAKEKGVVYGTGAWAKGDITSRDAMDQAYELGRES